MPPPFYESPRMWIIDVSSSNGNDDDDNDDGTNRLYFLFYAFVERD